MLRIPPAYYRSRDPVHNLKIKVSIRKTHQKRPAQAKVVARGGAGAKQVEDSDSSSSSEDEDEDEDELQRASSDVPNSSDDEDVVAEKDRRHAEKVKKRNEQMEENRAKKKAAKKKKKEKKKMKKKKQQKMGGTDAETESNVWWVGREKRAETMWTNAAVAHVGLESMDNPQRPAWIPTMAPKSSERLLRNMQT